jgi:hypothetical protein
LFFIKIFFTVSTIHFGSNLFNITIYRLTMGTQHSQVLSCSRQMTLKRSSTKLSPLLDDQVSHGLPPCLAKDQLMELLGIGPTKASELHNRPGFPVTREFRNPRSERYCSSGAA